ncbi:hypothetical protein Nepgr_011335 [Nepenthes gracilis]|uniref:Uncharacterized protein n=1 Tax=Nepenthes gracilis TaxID=150966 RepID=A0AAD3XM81_NEPGR|nr:hypothetical protein Nepgr_011335 [Nepenthes gracilis]
MVIKHKQAKIQSGKTKSRLSQDSATEGNGPYKWGYPKWDGQTTQLADDTDDAAIPSIGPPPMPRHDVSSACSDFHMTRHLVLLIPLSK